MFPVGMEPAGMILHNIICLELRRAAGAAGGAGQGGRTHSTHHQQGRVPNYIYIYTYLF